MKGEGMQAAIAVYPGSFDPFTNGHLDIISRALPFFQRIIVGVVWNPNKQPLFSSAERVDMIQQVCQKFGERVEVLSFTGLLVDFVESQGARVVLRGLRAISDYEYEGQLALTNRHLRPAIETFFLMAREEVSYVSSSMVKQVAMFGGDVSGLVPAVVAERLRAQESKVVVSDKN
jgi:pantetheine-phosphate adenylyltransferase